MRMSSQRDSLEEAIAVMQASEGRVSIEMVNVFADLTVHLEDAWRASNDWRMGAEPYDEPMRVKRALDEIAMALKHEEFTKGTDANHQFFRHALSAVLALATMRYSVLVEAGRMGEGVHASNEYLEMGIGFMFARNGIAPMRPGGAAAQDASRIGQIGGSWARFILDGVGA